MRPWINLIEALEDRYLVADNPPLADVDPGLLAKLAQEGFNVSLPLYHGSNQELTVLDHRYARSAAHIYTSSDAATAGDYGRNLYLCVGRTEPMADLCEDYQLIATISETFADDSKSAVEVDEEVVATKAAIAHELVQARGDPDYDLTEAGWDAEEDPRYKEKLHQAAKAYMTELITDGKLYEYSSSLQDSVMSECFSMGYKSVAFIDKSPEGSNGEWLSIVFKTGDDVAILKKVR